MSAPAPVPSSLDASDAVMTAQPVSEVMLALKSGDVMFVLARSIALESGLIKTALEKDPEATELSFHISCTTLMHAAVYLGLLAKNDKKHTPVGLNGPIEKKAGMVFGEQWENEWVRGLKKDLVDAIHAANYFDIPSMLNIAACFMAYRVKGCGTDEAKMKQAILGD
jgi:hypothetical protein